MSTFTIGLVGIAPSEDTVFVLKIRVPGDETSFYRDCIKKEGSLCKISGARLPKKGLATAHTTFDMKLRSVENDHFFSASCGVTNVALTLPAANALHVGLASYDIESTVYF